MALSFFKFPTQLLPSFSSFCNSQYYTASILPVKILDSSPSKSFFTSVSPVSSYASYFSRPFEEKEEQEEDDEEENAIGDCIVFEEDAFEDPYLWEKFEENSRKFDQSPRKSKSKQNVAITENLIPEEWKEVQQELNLTKKEKRRISQELQFGSRMRRRNRALPNMEDYLAYRSMKLSQLKPVVLDNPDYSLKEETGSSSVETENVGDVSTSSRVAPRNPRVAIAGDTFEDVADFFNSNDYEPGENGIKKSQGPRKLFTKEEKALLNKRTPKLEDATSSKWIPLHTLAAAGEFYLVDMLLKCNADINATNKDHLTALHKVIVCKKQAITNYLLRESANPFVRDNEGATLLHYAVLVASVPAIKTLLLYNVDINLPDNYGWTPLHLAVQTRRTDIVKLLLIKGADKTLKNQDGLTPLGLCLYSGRDMRTYELVKLLKEVPKSK